MLLVLYALQEGCLWNVKHACIQLLEANLLGFRQQTYRKHCLDVNAAAGMTRLCKIVGLCSIY